MLWTGKHVGVHTPLMQSSSAVQQTPLQQPVGQSESASIGWQVPPAHALHGLQTAGVPAHTPLVQMSPVVHASPSSQEPLSLTAATPQEPLTQVAVKHALGAAGQAFPHVPQFVGSDPKAVEATQAPLHKIVPDGQRHSPLIQVPPVQVLPHAPQLFG